MSQALELNVLRTLWKEQHGFTTPFYIDEHPISRKYNFGPSDIDPYTFRTRKGNQDMQKVRPRPNRKWFQSTYLTHYVSMLQDGESAKRREKGKEKVIGIIQSSTPKETSKSHPKTVENPHMMDFSGNELQSDTLDDNQGTIQETEGKEQHSSSKKTTYGKTKSIQQQYEGTMSLTSTNTQEALVRIKENMGQSKSMVMITSMTLAATLTMTMTKNTDISNSVVSNVTSKKPYPRPQPLKKKTITSSSPPSLISTFTTQDHIKSAEQRVDKWDRDGDQVMYGESAGERTPDDDIGDVMMMMQETKNQVNKGKGTSHTVRFQEDFEDNDESFMYNDDLEINMGQEELVRNLTQMQVIGNETGMTEDELAELMFDPDADKDEDMLKNNFKSEFSLNCEVKVMTTFIVNR